ncbi:MAG: hypothetical protein K2K98_04420 [Muribaculaceae bacterium]|nr:hypothetical protein [Muribaculaceae bacterium]
MDNLKFIPIEEKTLNDKLVNLYGSHIPGLYRAVKPLFDDPDAIKPALPLLIELNDDGAYENADIHVMVFGRETNNWNDIVERGQYPYGTYNFNLSTSEDILYEIKGRHADGEPEVYGIGDIYHAYCYEDSGVCKTVFTRRQNQLIRQLRSRLADLSVEAVWNNVSKIGCGGTVFGKSCRKPTAAIREIEREYFNVVAEEVKILKPDVVVFLTGFDADREIKDKFALADDAFHTVKEGLFLDRIDIPGVKYAARTIHPSRQSKENLKLHFDALVDDIISVVR